MVVAIPCLVLIDKLGGVFHSASPPAAATLVSIERIGLGGGDMLAPSPGFRGVGFAKRG
jgi:hypothetical protein